MFVFRYNGSSGTGSGVHEPAGREQIHEVPLLPASAAPSVGMPRKEAAASTGFPISGGRKGLGRRGDVPVFCPHGTLTIVRELEHTGRSGICTARRKFGTMILPLRAKSKSRWQAALAPSLRSPLGLSSDIAVLRASGKAVPPWLLFVLLSSSNGLRITSDDVLYGSAGALRLCTVTCMFEQKVLKKTGSFLL